jgi:hypothetical protein
LLALLVLYYTFVLPALWNCDEFFALLLVLGIVEGLMLFFASIWYLYRQSRRRRSAKRSRLRARSSLGITDVFDGSELSTTDMSTGL